MNRFSAQSRKLVVFGMLFMIIALNFNQFVRPAWLSVAAKDGVFGLLMGLAIGLNLLAIWRGRRGKPDCA
jgi:hypothetical protein